MIRHITALFLTLILITTGCGSERSADPTTGQPLTGQQVSEVVEAIAEQFDTVYVLPDVGADVAEHLRTQLAAKGYANATTTHALAAQLNRELTDLTHDGHVRLSVAGYQHTSEQAKRVASLGGRHGIDAVRMIDDRYGYMDIISFDDPREMDEEIVEAFHAIEGAEAIIFDLRNCRGGYAETIHLFNHILQGSDLLLFSYYDREGDLLFEGRTPSHDPPIDMTTIPVFVLTSDFTFSGGEEFAYGLRHSDRATIIGEPTGGGGHLVSRATLPHGFSLSVPFARPVHPVSGGYWEGSGVLPDIEVDESEAYERALEFLHGE